MHWMDQTNSWWDAHNQDTDYINYTMDDLGSGDMLAQTGTWDPYYISSTWGWGQSVFWYNFT